MFLYAIRVDPQDDEQYVHSVHSKPERAIRLLHALWGTRPLERISIPHGRAATQEPTDDNLTRTVAQFEDSLTGTIYTIERVVFDPSFPLRAEDGSQGSLFTDEPGEPDA